MEKGKNDVNLYPFAKKNMYEIHFYIKITILQFFSKNAFAFKS